MASRRLHSRASASRPSTAMSMATSVANWASNVVVALSEGRGTASEVGLVCFDKAAGELSLSQYADTQQYSKTLQQLHLVQPSEILVSNTLIEPFKSRLVKTRQITPKQQTVPQNCNHHHSKFAVEDDFGADLIVPVNRAWFNQNKGLQNISEFSLEESVIPGLSSKLYFATSCVAAILTYVEERDEITYYRNSLRFKFFSLDGIMSIDHITARNLELIINLETNKSAGSLFGVLNNCQTGMGARLLRMNVLQPLNDLETINCRLNAVEDLKSNQARNLPMLIFVVAVLSDVRIVLKASVDMDALIMTLLYRPKKHTVKVTENYITAIITLKHLISNWISAIHEIITGCESDLLKITCSNLKNESIDQLAALIDERINEDITYQKNAQGMRNQRCYAVKAGWNGLLDVARQTYRESTNDVYDLVAGYSTTYGLPIKTKYSKSQGFTLKLNLADLDQGHGSMPSEFINVVKTKKQATFTTLALLGFNDRINESLTEVYLMSDKIIAELVVDVSRFAGLLYNISESIALLDMLASFAHVADTSDFVRPEFTETLAVKAGKHPIRDHFASNSGDKFVPNDVYCCDGANMQIISGPNMSGKTTYLKMIVLLNIIAQMGSFIPAEYASFRLQAQVFSRIGCDSVVEASASSFMSEMRESAYILQNVCDRSLVIIDELGRGTSHTDGIAMSIAISEKLAETKAFTFIATHFIELGVNLASTYANVVKLHLHVECLERDENVNIHFKYQVQDGTSNVSNYGLTIAKLAHFPQSAIDDALQVANALDCAANKKREEALTDQERIRKQAAIRVYYKLVQARLNSRLNEPALRLYLKSLKEEL
ncbi:muts domain V-domain-containing protein [Chytriomyces cf. hyalinus JEL632]|nr:muts domain V-domain-containing protein [Chytriomyces cf. hyalinus JEL632]